MVRTLRDLLRLSGLVLLLVVGGTALPGALGAHSPALPGNPPNPYLIVGYVLNPSKTPAPGTTVWVNDTTQGPSWTPLTATTDPSGYYQVDLSGGTPNYANGDTITVQASVSGLVSSNTTTVNEGSFDGYSWCNDTLGIAPLSVHLSVHPAQLFVGQTANLTAPVSGGVAPYQFNWTFGDGTARAITHPQNYTHHVYAAPGTFQAQVTANSSITGNVTATQTIVVSPVPTLTLSYQPPAPQAGTGSWVLFSSAISPAGRAWYDWFSFGDGANSGLLAPGVVNVRHTYASPGTYTANVTAWNASTGYRVDSSGVRVTVGPGLVAGLSVLPAVETEVGVGTAFTASATGSRTPVTYQFQFGDGATAGPQATTVANHTYATSGNVTATVSETNITAASASASLPLEVLRHVGLTFVASTLAGESPLPVVFRAQGYAGEVGNGYVYDFWLGDRTNYTGNSSGTTVTTYLGAGTYTATAKVTDALGATAWANLTVQVTGPVPLAASASATPLTAPAGTLITFTGDATGGVAPYAFAWSFGDLTGTYLGQNATHEYTQPGTYTAWLNVTDSDRPADLASAQVVLHVEPEVPLAISLQGPHGAAAGQLLTFVLNVTGGIPPYTGIFLFEDGSGGSEISPTALTTIPETHAFTAGGTYVVTVFLNDSNPAGASSLSAQITVVVKAPPGGANSGYSQYLPGGTLFPLLLLLVVIAVAVLLIIAFARRRKKEEMEARAAILGTEAAGGTAVAAGAAGWGTSPPASPPAPENAPAPAPAPASGPTPAEPDAGPVEWDELGNEGAQGYQEGSGGGGGQGPAA